LKTKVQFPSKVKVSELSINFIQKCLTLKEKDRMSWEEVFTHPLFKEKFKGRIKDS